MSLLLLLLIKAHLSYFFEFVPMAIPAWARLALKLGKYPAGPMEDQEASCCPTAGRAAPCSFRSSFHKWNPRS